MKKLLTVLIISFVVTGIYAQVPEGFNYQAVARDSKGNVRTNETIDIRFTLQPGALSNPEWIETHSVKTDSFGVFTAIIGTGTKTGGLSAKFSDLNFTNGEYWIMVEVKDASNWETVSTLQKFWAVPYAIHSKTAESIKGGITETDPVFGASVAAGITGTDTTNWNSKMDSYTETDPVFLGWDKDYNDLTNTPNLSDSINSKAVMLTGDQTIAGKKTFTDTISANNLTISDVADPISDQDASTKAYVDEMVIKVMNAFARNNETFTSLTTGTLKDIEGNTYKTINIGGQWWMAENLRTIKYTNGSNIQIATTNSTWSSGGAAYCWLDNDYATYGSKYGAIYNFGAVNIQVLLSAQLCPIGWHVPSDQEWTIMENYLIDNGFNYDSTLSGNKIAKSLASTSGWLSSSVTGTVGNNDYPAVQNRTGFNALPGGGRHNSGIFNTLKDTGAWWSSTEAATGYAWNRSIYNNQVVLSKDANLKEVGFSIRCVRD